MASASTPVSGQTVAPGTTSAVHYGGLGLGVASVSVAAILIRLADAPSLTVAAYRLGIAALIVGAIALIAARGQFRFIRRADLPWLALSGVLLAAHFAAFITSLSMISVSNAVLLTTTTPVFVALASPWTLGERAPSRVVAAILLSMVGGVILAWEAINGSSNANPWGYALALLAAITVAGHMMIGRKVRRHIPLLPYITVAYSVAGAVLIVAALAAGSPLTGLSGTSYFWMFMVAFVPQVMGHSMLNWSLAHFNATIVTLSVRIEPVVATLLAIPILGEVPAWTIIPGGALVMMGVFLAATAEQPRLPATAKAV